LIYAREKDQAMISIPSLFSLEMLQKLVRRNRSRIGIAVIILFTVIFTGCTPAMNVSQANSAESLTTPSVSTTVVSTPSLNLCDESLLVSLYERTMPSVVKIEAVIKKESQTIGPFQFGPFQQEGQGSGFVIDEQGHILTNNHVIDGASSVKVNLYKSKVIDAQIVGTDRENDLALLKIDPVKVGNLIPLVLGDSAGIKPGQMAIALGAPFGLEGSITAGIVSAVGRSIPSSAQRLITDMIQTDAAINPGNSGGPLLNSKGEVIGINTAIEASSTGIGFAIPINTAKSLLPALQKGGEVTSPWLGIKGQAISPEVSTKLDLSTESGVYVIEVTTDSPAEKAGLRGSGTDSKGQPTFGGDVIVAVDGHVVTRVEDLLAYFNAKKPGDEVSLEIYRGDKKMTLKATLGEWPE
jgi:S1-C subfamily serine protease